MRRTTKLAVITAALIIGLTGCGKDDPKRDTGSSSSPSSAGPSTDAPTPTATDSPSPSATSTSGALSRARPGLLEVVPADEAIFSKSGCKAQPAGGLVCTAEGKGYRFQPEAVRKVKVIAVKAGTSQGGQWVVDIQLGRAGAARFAALTRKAAATHQVALVMLPASRRVLAAASVAAPIVGGNVEITSSYTRSQATRIVKLVTATAG